MVFIFPRTLITHIFQRVLLNFGADGTSLFPLGLRSMCIFHSVETGTAQKVEIRCNEEKFAAELDGDAITFAPLQIELDEVPIKFLA